MDHEDMKIRLTDYGFRAEWADSNGQRWEQTVDCRDENFVPKLWTMNAAAGEGL